MEAYVELHCHSNYSFLDGASHPEELVRRAADLGMPALALTDHDGLYAAVPFHRACREAGIRPILGAEMTLEGGDHLTLLAQDAVGYRNLCRLITAAHRGWGKGKAQLDLGTLSRHTEGLLCLSGCRKGTIARLLLGGQAGQALEFGRRLRDLFGRGNFWIELQHHLEPGDRRLVRDAVHLAEALGVGYVATNNVHYAVEAGYRLHDVLTAIRHRAVLDMCPALRPNSEFYLKSAAETAALFGEWPEAVSNSLLLAERCRVDLDFTAYRFPEFPLPEGETAHGYLVKLCRERLRERYLAPSAEAEGRLEYELELIRKLGLSGYFLIVWDIMEYARRNGIPAQGRGSAANSIVAYILGITRVDPVAHRLFVGRFINEEMSAIPDIDIDISTGHRERLIQYVYRKYGPERTAMVATFVTFQARNAIREVGKVLGLPAGILDRMARSVAVYRSGEIGEDLGKLEEFRRYLSAGPWETFLALCREIGDFPRHLSIHVGGMLVSACPLTDIVPLEPAAMPGRVVCQWDKDGVADAGLIKIDLLGLRMLSLVREACDLVEAQTGQKLDLSQVPHDDPAVYEDICRCDTVGVFQIESRAQMQTLPRTRPRSIEDLTIEVAIIRPGPLQGNMVHPYLRRRKGVGKVTYLHPVLKPILEETLGVILFQEQVIQVAVAIAGFTLGEADALRRAMSRKRSKEAMERLRACFIEGAARNGIGRETAERVFEALKGFAAYGFCKSHAAGFALLSYESAWLKHYYPAAFYAALLSNQPMGFYGPEVIVHDARRHGIAVLPVEINRSAERCTVEGGAVRMGLRYVKGLGEKAIGAILAERAKAPFRSLEDFHGRVRLERGALENLVLAGAFDGFGLSRRDALWRLALLERSGPLPVPFPNPVVSLPELTPAEEMGFDYEVQGLSPKHHPMEVLGRGLAAGCVRSSALAELPAGSRVRVSGYVITRQRPGTAKGFSFLTIEDEAGMMNLVLKPDIYERYRQTFRLEPMVVVEGILERRDGVVNILVEELLPLRPAEAGCAFAREPRRC